MIKILQYGEGNFLRTFVDYYFDELNLEGGDYSINIVKPITFGTLERFEKQNNKYHVVLRGSVKGKTVETVKKVNVLNSVICPFTNYDKYIALAKDSELKVIVSNTTEAGICFNANDKIEGFENITYPAKLTKFLFERFSAGLDGVYLMPVELIDNNADELKKCVDNYIELWDMPKAFKDWNDSKNFYCNTLVDRIVSGYPKTEEDVKYIENLIGEKDQLVSIGEPFGLWAVEKKGDIAKYIKEGSHGIDVVLTENIGYYKKRKVRVLNGSHTNIVPYGLLSGAITVYDCMTNDKLKNFLIETLDEEIIPFVSNDISATKEFADSVIDRFYNPYLNHQLVSISLNSISKWKARVLPSFKDYFAKYNKIPKNLTFGFACLMKIYSGIKQVDDKYTYELKERTIQIQDDLPYLQYFANGGSVKEFMADVNVWGEDLTLYEGFYDKVSELIKSL